MDVTGYVFFEEIQGLSAKETVFYYLASFPEKVVEWTQ